MKAYYNENNPFCANWLRNLIKKNYLPDGDVDERSIEDVNPEDLNGYSQCHWFAGIGGWSLALKMAGWPEHVEVWTASPPCQPFSSAGKNKGYDDERNLTPKWLELVKQCQPANIFGEQVAGAFTNQKYNWIDDLQNALENENYATGKIVLPTCSVGGSHIRQRGWFFAHTEWNKQQQKKSCSGKIGRMGRVEQSFSWNESWQSALSFFRALDDGIPRCVEATDAARNAIVPQVAAEVINAFIETINENLQE